MPMKPSSPNFRMVPWGNCPCSSVNSKSMARTYWNRNCTQMNTNMPSWGLSFSVSPICVYWCSCAVALSPALEVGLALLQERLGPLHVILGGETEAPGLGLDLRAAGQVHLGARLDGLFH